jgi:hypothetical protein
MSFEAATSEINSRQAWNLAQAPRLHGWSPNEKRVPPLRRSAQASSSRERVVREPHDPSFAKAVCDLPT